MPLEFRKKKRAPVSVIVALSVALSLTGCWKKSGDAVVIAKDYVPAMKVSETPAASSEQSAKGEQPPQSEEAAEDTVREDSGDDLSGPAMDSRATDHDQWIATVRMITDGKIIEVRCDLPQWEALKIGDRVHVRYRQGKYTGTVWSAEIK